MMEGAVPAPSSPHDRPSHESNADNHTAYDQLILLCLREAGAATELLRGTKGLGLSSPEAQALASDMLEAQRDFVCALALWDRADDAQAATRLAKKLVGVSEGVDALARRGRDLPSGALGADLWAGAADEATRHAAAGARAAALVRAFDTVDAQLADCLDDLARVSLSAARGSPLDASGAVPLCAAAIHARLEATRAVAQLVLDALF